MAGFPTTPPRTPPHGKLSIGWGTVDPSEFDVDGTVRFSFVNEGQNIGEHLRIRLTTQCIDDNPKWIPWKDCRPSVHLSILSATAYEYDSTLGVKKIYTFRAHLNTRPTDDDECLLVDLVIDVQAGTDVLPGMNLSGDIKSILGNASLAAALTPVLTWTIPFRVCCHKCRPTYAFNPTNEELG